MVELWSALTELATKYILGVTGPTEAWTLLDRQYGDRNMAIATALNRLHSLKMPNVQPYNQVEAMVQCMRHIGACLKAVNAEDKMFSNTGTEAMHRDWLRYLEEHHQAIEEDLFQQWLDQEGKAAVRQ